VKVGCRSLRMSSRRYLGFSTSAQKATSCQALIGLSGMMLFTAAIRSGLHSGSRTGQNQLRIASVCRFPITRHERDNFRGAGFFAAPRCSNHSAMVCLPFTKSSTAYDRNERFDTQLRTASCVGAQRETKIGCPSSIRVRNELRPEIDSATLITDITKLLHKVLGESPRNVNVAHNLATYLMGKYSVSRRKKVALNWLIALHANDLKEFPNDSRDVQDRRCFARIARQRRGLSRSFRRANATTPTAKANVQQRMILRFRRQMRRQFTP